MPKTLRLSDLYVVGREFTIEGPQGKVTVWIQKMNPVDYESAMRKAGAKRSKTLAIARFDTDPELKDVFYNQLFDITPDRESMIAFLVTDDIARVRAAREAEVADKDEWKEDDYLQGLKDLWNDEMASRFVENPEDMEAKKVYDELARFEEQVIKEVEAERKAKTRDYENWSDEKVADAAVKKLIEASADMDWLQEFRKCELFYGVKDPKTKKPYFESRAEVDGLESEVLGQLIQAYQSLNIDPVEGKD